MLRALEEVAHAKNGNATCHVLYLAMAGQEVCFMVTNFMVFGGSLPGETTE